MLLSRQQASLKIFALTTVHFLGTINLEIFSSNLGINIDNWVLLLNMFCDYEHSKDLK